VNIIYDNDEIPLFNASYYGNETIVKYLVEHGADYKSRKRGR